MNSDQHSGSASAGTISLSLAALGVVYGDIGTSPLYALKEAFTEPSHTLTVDAVNVYGVCSLVFWSLIIVISVKYLLFVMRADNHGEGGILALTSLIPTGSDGTTRRRTAGLIGLGVFGTALLYGDGVITPAISVLSAVEGLEVASPAFSDWVLPIAVAILVGLFVVQRWGTGNVGRVFGPVMIVWFVVLGALGAMHISDSVEILRSVNPVYALRFFGNETKDAFLSLGSVFLVVTGGEALYADMGHFGRRPILYGWYSLVLPGLLLNYWGQGAMVLAHPEKIDRAFFEMAPERLVVPLVLLATMATIIASQALISGVYSLTKQAVQLDYLPRVDIRHTSGLHSGQIYVPLVNWALMVACVGVVLGFQTSSRLAAAYGIAVTMTMVITTIIFYSVARRKWGWQRWKALLVCAPLLVIESAYFGANIVKVPHGGWFALVVALGLLVQMMTWRRGRQLVAERIKRGEQPVEEVLEEAGWVAKVDGTAVFMFKDAGMAPPAFVNNLRHNKVLHRNTLLVSVVTDDVPRVPDDRRYEITRIEPGLHQVVLHYGFMEEPNVPASLAAIDYRGVHFDPDDATYFIGRETVLAGKAPGMNPLAEQLFVLLNRGAASASRFFNLPSDRVFEVGSHVEL